MLTLGQKVRILSTGEVGVVSWVWTDVYGDVDTLVTCFGKDFPEGEPVGPGLLRYCADSLESI